MTCTVCGKRAARRACPALHADICTVCCGTKRVTEIRCPADCHYLATARAHPAAVVRRQQEDDLRAFIPSVQELNEAQADLLWRLLAFIRDHRGDELVRTTDADVESAARALASTYETAARGLIYEERADSLAAQRLAADLKPLLAQLAEAERPPSLERDLAAVFRAIERGAREARKHAPGGETAYLALLQRLITPSQAAPDEVVRPEAAGGGSLIVRP